MKLHEYIKENGLEDYIDSLERAYQKTDFHRRTKKYSVWCHWCDLKGGWETKWKCEEIWNYKNQ